MFNVGLTEMRLVLMCDGGSGVCQEEKKQMLKTKRSVKTERKSIDSYAETSIDDVVPSIQTTSILHLIVKKVLQSLKSWNGVNYSVRTMDEQQQTSLTYDFLSRVKNEGSFPEIKTNIARILISDTF